MDDSFHRASGHAPTRADNSTLGRRISLSARGAKWSASSRPTEVRRSASATTHRAIKGYVRSLKGLELLSVEEEHLAAVAYREHRDLRQAERLLRSNLRLVVKIANEYARHPDQLPDLIQEGNLGLMHALGKFEPDRRIKLSSYAAWWIRAYILKFVLANFRVVRIGKTVAQRKMFYRLRSEQARMERDGQEVDVRCLAKALSVKPEEVIDMQQRLESPEVSMDCLSTGDRPLYALSAQGGWPDDLLARREIHERVRHAIARLQPTLSGREMRILTERLLSDNPKTLRQLGAQSGVTRERVRQQEVRLKEKLRICLSQQFGSETEFLAKAA